MSEVYTYSYIKDMLSKVNENNKLKWSDFLIVFQYLDIKLKNIEMLKKKKLLTIINKAIVLEIVNQMNKILNNNLVENDMTSKQIRDILNEIVDELNQL
jgi:hypothetical protein